MNLDEAGRLQEAWKIKNGDQSCQHSRVVDCFTTREGQKTGKLVCRECGAIYPNPHTSQPDSSSLQK